jgi:hypothetical protein
LYSLKNVLTKNPVEITGVVMSFVNLGVIVDIIDLSADSVSALNIALMGLLGLFVAKTTVSTTRLEEVSSAVMGAQVNEGSVTVIEPESPTDG